MPALGAKLHGEALASLGTTGLQDIATALGCHTGTETMALRTLALVRLIGTFHCNPPRGTAPFHIQSSFEIVVRTKRESQGANVPECERIYTAA